MMMPSDEADDMVRNLKRVYSDMPQQFAVDSDVVRSAVSARRGRRRSIAAVTVGLTVVASVGVLAWQLPSEQPSAGAESILIQSSALELYASSTASDWVRNADVAVLAKVTDEESGPATSVGDGSGDKFMVRSVTIEVLQQLWGRAGLPDLDDGGSIEISAPGTVVRDDGSVSKLAVRSQPRLEIGNSYVLALVCEPSLSGGGPSWVTLGTGAVIPFEAGVLGNGESEGRPVSGDIDQTLPNSLERDTLGEGVGVIETRLRTVDGRTAPRLPSQENRC